VLSLVAFILGVIVSVGVLLPQLLGLRSRLAAAKRRAETMEREITNLRRAGQKIEEDQQFLFQFLKEFPNYARELYAGVKERELPAVLLNVVMRSLRPTYGAVMVRRGKTEGDPRQPRMVVAAVAPDSSKLKTGTEVPMDKGDLAFVAGSQLVMNRQDLVTETTRGKVKEQSLPGFEADLVAPMVYDQETLGLIAVTRPQKTSADAKAALHLVARTGAQALHNAATLSQMKVSADMDGLTGIFNKRHMTQTLSDLIYKAACKAYDSATTTGRLKPATLAIFLFDLDNFKNYNDVNGHVAGDRLLQELAGIVQQSIRKDDIFGRFGGEEFLVIFPNINAAQAMAAAQKLRSVITSHKFPFGEKQPLGLISVSGGVAEYPYDGLDATSLLHKADEALYEAKRQGRNKVLAVVRPGEGGEKTDDAVAATEGAPKPA
jgi:diguanylate cyclase (GGDEF)-like protein